MRFLDDDRDLCSLEDVFVFCTGTSRPPLLGSNDVAVYPFRRHANEFHLRSHSHAAHNTG